MIAKVIDRSFITGHLTILLQRQTLCYGTCRIICYQNCLLFHRDIEDFQDNFPLLSKLQTFIFFDIGKCCTSVQFIKAL